jgi:hypothetical protein
MSIETWCRSLSQWIWPIPLCQLTLLDRGLLSLQFPHYVTA